MTKSRIEHLEEHLNELTHVLGEVKIAVELIREKQGSQLKRFEGIKESFHQHREHIKECLNKLEKRLHSLEDFMRASLQRLSYAKGLLFKLLPVLITLCLACFSVGIFVDDEKVATEIRHTIGMKG